jgi:hypothetical protein
VSINEGILMNRFAEDANYWQTTVRPSKSQSEIMERLDDFGASQYQVTQGRSLGRVAWLIRFEWREHSYRFIFVPLECKKGDVIHSFGGKRRPHHEQALYQMGRIAVHFIKAILTAAETHPYALFGFMELPGTASEHGMPLTAGEMDISQVQSMLPALPGPTVEE